jgi:hypothetical protein
MPVKKGPGCVREVMKEWKAGKLHSGEDGKVVKNQKQAVAIALSMCGKSEGKSYEEAAKDVLSTLKEDFAEKSCGCKHKKGTKEYGECNCGCPMCKRRMSMAIGYPTPTFSEEDTKMALSQLRKLKADTSHLIMMMEQEMMMGRMPEIEAWMESKITLAADYMAAVHDYAMYGPGLEVEEEEEEEGDEEGPQAMMPSSYAEAKKSLPREYKKGLTKEEQEIAKRETKETMAKAKKPGSSAKEVYEDWESDKKYKSRQKKQGKDMPKSKVTEAYERMYGKDSEDMAEGGSEKSLKEKAKKSGIPYGILKQVFERGMAAWRTGHRPGVSPQQWAHARVSSFITGSGGARKADADLWKKAQAARSKR